MEVRDRAAIHRAKTVMNGKRLGPQRMRGFRTHAWGNPRISGRVPPPTDSSSDIAFERLGANRSGAPRSCHNADLVRKPAPFRDHAEPLGPAPPLQDEPAEIRIP